MVRGLYQTTEAMTESLMIRRAVADDMQAILDMIDEAAAWLAEKGTDQWARPWPDRESRDRRIRNGLRSGDTWMVEVDGAPVATVTFRKRGNWKLWTILERCHRAVYLSRLIVRRDYAGSGIGEALVDWAGLRARRDWRARWTRIDVWTTNAALHNYYEKRGFQSRGIRRSAQRAQYPSAALFQKPTASIDPAALTWFTEVTGPGMTQAYPAARGHRARRRVRRDWPGRPVLPSLPAASLDEPFLSAQHANLDS